MLSLLLGLVKIISETKSYICFCCFFLRGGLGGRLRDVSANVVRTRLIVLRNNDMKLQDWLGLGLQRCIKSEPITWKCVIPVVCVKLEKGM